MDIDDLFQDSSVPDPSVQVCKFLSCQWLLWRSCILLGILRDCVFARFSRDWMQRKRLYMYWQVESGRG